jgi:hypothetical protein
MSMQETIHLNVKGLFENHYGIAPQDPEALRAFQELLPRVVSMMVHRLQQGCNCTDQPPF